MQRIVWLFIGHGLFSISEITLFYPNVKISPSGLLSFYDFLFSFLTLYNLEIFPSAPLYFSECLSLEIKAIANFQIMEKKFFKLLAKVNKKILPSFTKRKVDLARASKLQLAIFAYKLWVVKNALD